MMRHPIHVSPYRLLQWAFCFLMLRLVVGTSQAIGATYGQFSVRGQSPSGARMTSGSPWNPVLVSPEISSDARNADPVLPNGGNQITAGHQTYQRLSAQPLSAQPFAQGTGRPVRVVEPGLRPSDDYPDYHQWNRQQVPPFEWQMFPEGLLWPAYLAGVKESRFRGVWHKEDSLGWIWDITLGGRAGILRYGNRNAVLPTGIQLDIEGAAMTRLALDKDRDVEATDYRFGLPLSFGNETWQFKLAYYHVSCHLGDEYMLRHLEEDGVLPRRINYYRDSLVFGIAFKPHRDIRLYGEIEYAVYSGEMTERLQMQFGAEYAPLYPANRRRGVPFFAVNALLMEELDFGGSVCVQAGWMWRGRRNQAFRLGLEYFYGADDQYEFFDETNSKLGFGLWYDF